jgi:hypothetical protein
VEQPTADYYRRELRILGSENGAQLNTSISAMDSSEILVGVESVGGAINSLLYSRRNTSRTCHCRLPKDASIGGGRNAQPVRARVALHHALSCIDGYKLPPTGYQLPCCEWCARQVSNLRPPV